MKFSHSTGNRDSRERRAALAAALLILAGLILPGCPPPLADRTLLDPPPPWEENKLARLSVKDLCRMADRTQNAWSAMAQHSSDRLQDPAAIAHAERFAALFRAMESKREDQAWKTRCRTMQREADRISHEEVGTFDIEGMLVDGVFRRCLGCHDQFKGPKLDTSEYRARYGKAPVPATP